MNWTKSRSTGRDFVGSWVRSQCYRCLRLRLLACERAGRTVVRRLWRHVLGSCFNKVFRLPKTLFIQGVCLHCTGPQLVVAIPPTGILLEFYCTGSLIASLYNKIKHLGWIKFWEVETPYCGDGFRRMRLEARKNMGLRDWSIKLTCFEYLRAICSLNLQRGFLSNA